MAQKINASTRYPCPLCGHTDWCCTVKYPDGDVYWCGRTGGETPIVAGGKVYDLIATKEKGGIYYLYMDHADREASKKKWIEEQKKNNPDWKNRAQRFPKKGSSLHVEVKRERQPLKEEGIVSPLPNEALDKIYRRMLELLVLEKKHQKLLLEKEWFSDVYPDLGAGLLRRYPIRSLPPEDKIRFLPLLKGEYENKSRKQVVSTLMKEFGSLKGVPGFYKRGGKYWEGKTEEERWTFVAGEGIIFPCYDENGYLYRIRIRADYPKYCLRSSRGEDFDGKEGDLVHAYGENGEHLWYFQEKGTRDRTLVYGPSVRKIELKRDGCPTIGKSDGKYKNFSSESLKEFPEEGVVRNAYQDGCKSGSPYSIYLPEKIDWRVVMITEGEKKGIVSSEVKQMPLITLPGVLAMSVCFERDEGKPLADFLKEKGTVGIIIAFDADKAENKMVKSSEEQIVQRFLEKGFRVYTAEWSGDFNKGIDDILLMGLDISLKAQK